MKRIALIVGLGNPGRKFLFTRHNLGFIVVDRLAIALKLRFRPFYPRLMVAQGSYKEINVVLAKPLTYMNRSGDVMGCLCRHFDVDAFQILVICDDLYLNLGRIRLRRRGGSGGHKGLKSIIEALSTEDFPRLRIGICPLTGFEEWDQINFVLSSFRGEEKEIVERVVSGAVEAVYCYLEEGIEKAMTKYNSVVF